MRYVARFLIVTLALVLLGLVLTPTASPAQAAGPCDPNRPIPYWWHLRPLQPCSGDEVTLVFGSCRDCVEILGYSWPDSVLPRLDLRVNDACPAITVCRPDSVEVPLGRLPAGYFQVKYMLRAGVVYDDTGFCYVERPDSLRFAITCPAPPPPSDTLLPYVTALRIGPPPTCAGCPPRICPGAPIPFHIAGAFPDGCYQFTGLELVPSPIVGPRAEPPIVRLHVDRRVCSVCALYLKPWSADTVLAGLPPGTYELMLQMVVRSTCDSSATRTETFAASRAFTVKDTCAGVPPPPGPLPFVSNVQIGLPPCDSCPPRICPAVPIPVLVTGTLPSNCYQFRKLQLLPSPLEVYPPPPPTLRIVVAQNDCMEWPCDNVVRPWQASALLPGQLPGIRLLPLEVAVVSMCDSTRVDTIYRSAQAFTVPDSCPMPPVVRCVREGWDHTVRFGACDAFVRADSAAEVTMTLWSTVPLAGLQGTLRLSPPGLRVSALAPVGSAKGAHLTWQPTADGARFVMFAEQGAPIGAPDSNWRCLAFPVGCPPVPVLRVGLLPVPGATPAPVTFLSAHDLLGSDANGTAVEPCNFPTLVAVQATICSGHSCDFNQDGHLDVRDLVTMVHCILGGGACPDTVRAQLDCNGDGLLGVDDVLCCARSILRGGERDTSGARPEPDVAVEVGEPAWTAAGLDVPIRLSAADRVGAARLALSLPLDLYDVTGVELADGSPEWLELHDAVDGQLVLGLIGLGSETASANVSTLGLTLHLALKPGRSGGGDLGLADLQVSGRDGVTLEVAGAPAPVPLPAPGALLLSAARPNPFTHETRFGLNLDRGVDVDLSVHDLSGRRVATIYHGALAAGPHEFAWSGTRGDGGTAANGIYFLQANVGGQRLARKVIFLRGN